MEQAHAVANYLSIPLAFEANQGQTDPRVQFVSRGAGYSLFLTQDEVILSLRQQSSATAGNRREAAPVKDKVAYTLRMKLVGASSGAAVAGAEPMPGVVSYFIGNDPKKWHSGIPTFGKVCYTRVYPGVDLVFYGNQRQLEYDFIVAPGADPSRIAWQIDGASAGVDAEGNLVLNAPHGPASFQKPVLYQMDGDRKVGVEGSFAIAGNQIRFQIGDYDHARPLVIDPVLTYASYLAGTGADYIGWPMGPGNLQVGVSNGLAVDSEGSVYVAGTTYSLDFPTENAYESTPPTKTKGVQPGEWPSAFVTKFSPDGRSLEYSTYLGGEGSDHAYAIAVDRNGDAYVTGQTNSIQFPITSGAYQTVCAPDATDNAPPYTASCNYANTSAFVTRLNSSGTGLVYSTFLGGYGWAYAMAIAVDDAGRAYVAGNTDIVCTTSKTFEACFPTTDGAVIPGSLPNGGSPQYSFLSAFDPTGSELLYSTLFGDKNPGGGATWVTGVAVDPQNYVYLIGETEAAKLPTTKGVVQPTGAPLYPTGTFVEGFRGFVAKFYPVAAGGGSSLAYGTYLGGHTANLSDFISGIAFDGASNAYVAGYTNSPDFPVTTGAFSTVCAPNGGTCAAAHITKLNPSGTAILWSTFVGDRKTDSSDAVYYTGPIQLDGKGNIFIIGQVGFGFPMVGPVEPTPVGGSMSLLVAELDPTGSRLKFSTTIGSSGLHTAEPAGLAVDKAGDIFLAGNHIGPGLITTPGAFQTTVGDSLCCYHGFVARIAARGKAAVALAISPAKTQYGEAVTLTATVSTSSKYASMPTGKVTFLDGTATVSSANLDSTGKATFHTSGFLPRTHQLTASYGGDSTYPAGASPVKTGNVAKMATVVTLKVSPNPAFAAQRVVCTAKVAAAAGNKVPSGSVTFMDGTKVLYREALNSVGVASYSISSLTTKSHTITAAYGGSPGFAASTSKAVIVKINPKVATATTLSASATSVVAGTSVTLTAKVKPASGTIVATGSVTFMDGTNPLGTGTMNHAGAAAFSTAKLATGSHPIVAVYSGDAGDIGSKSAVLTVKVTSK